MKSSDIKQLRTKLNLNQTDFGKKIGVSLRSIQAYEKGITKPSADTLLKLLELQKENTQNGARSNPAIINTNGNKFIELPDGTYDIEVKELPFKAYASYAETLEAGIAYEDFNTAIFNVDKVGRGHYMAFVVKGDSMNGGRIEDTPDGAKVLGRELQKPHWRDGFNPTKYGWIILCKQNIFHKDITGFDPEKGIITCHSRNTSPEYSDFELKLDECYQIFKVIKRIF